MATGGAARPVEETVVVPDWVMLNRFGRTYGHVGLDSAREAANKNKTAVEFVTATGHHCCVSFTLSDRPEGISYLDIDWPLQGSAQAVDVASYVRATDEDLVLFDIYVPSEPRFYYGLPSDLFVYTAGPLPSVKLLPVYAQRRERPFLMSTSTTGILRLADDRYIVSDLNVYSENDEDPDNYPMLAELCVLDSKTEEWELFLKMPTPQPHFPVLWSTDDVLAFDRRFLCWADYLRGALLCDFSNLKSPLLRFVPFPGGGEEYSQKLRCIAARFRHVSFIQGIMHFVHIDNDYHERILDGWHPQKITIWTLNMRDGNLKSEWKIHRVINLDCLWAQRGYQALDIRQCLPEFPVICAKEPDALWCLLRDEQLSGQPWMIIIDMNHAYLRACTKYINQQPYDEAEYLNEKAMKAHQDFYYNVPLLPTVFSKYLVGPTGIPRDNKLTTNPSKKVKLATHPIERASEDEDLECDDCSDLLDAEIKDAVARHGQPRFKIGKYRIDGMKTLY